MLSPMGDALQQATVRDLASIGIGLGSALGQGYAWSQGKVRLRPRAIAELRAVRAIAKGPRTRNRIGSESGLRSGSGLAFVC